MINVWQTWIVSNLLKEEIYNKWKWTPNKESKLSEVVKLYSNQIQAKCVLDSGELVSCLLYNHVAVLIGIIRAQRIMICDNSAEEYGQAHYYAKIGELKYCCEDYKWSLC